MYQIFKAPVFIVVFDMDWDKVSLLKSSARRRTVLEALRETPLTPTECAENCELTTQGASDVLRDLREHGLVELLVDDDRRVGRLYGISDSGERALDALDGNSKHEAA